MAQSNFIVGLVDQTETAITATCLTLDALYVY